MRSISTVCLILSVIAEHIHEDSTTLLQKKTLAQKTKKLEVHWKDSSKAKKPNPNWINLGTAGNFAILSKSGVTNTGATSITGDVGTSPIAATAITGFGLVLDSSTLFSTSTYVSHGRVYAADYTTPTSPMLTVAILDMQAAFVDTAGRVPADETELGAGNIDGMTLSPGIYKWGTNVDFAKSLTFSGTPDDVWIMQIAGNLVLGSSARVVLSGGAQAENIFWQVSGYTRFGTDSHAEGVFLCKTKIVFQTRSSLNGVALSQTAVTLDAATIVKGGQHSTGHHLGGGMDGDEASRQFMIFDGMPMGEDSLRAAGWTMQDGDGCDEGLGFAWTQEASGVTKEKPMTLYTTAGGQPSGVGVVIFGHGHPPLPGPQMKWATREPLVEVGLAQADGEQAQVDVAFRSGDIMCSGKKDNFKIGNMLIVNPNGASKIVPLVVDGIEKNGFRRGSCFDTMGWHWLLDTSKADGELSWEAENVFPIVPMYHDGYLRGFFFAATVQQQGKGGQFNGWDPRPVTNSQMCDNTCDAECTFEGLPGDVWSTLHVFFGDHSKVTCELDLECKYRPPAPLPFSGSCCAK